MICYFPSTAKLIDSSCWVDYYRPSGDARIQEAVSEAIKLDEAAIWGMIRLEILGYIARQEEYDAVAEDFSGLHDLPITHTLFNSRARTGNPI